MVSSGVPRAILVAATVVLAPCAFAAGEPSAEEQRERQILSEIEQIQVRGGPYAPELLDALEGLVLLYQERGDHALALVAIEQAVQAIRIKRGLHTLDQVPLLLQRIKAEDALGDHAAVWDHEQELLTLLRRHPDDLGTVPAMHELADRQMAVLERVMAGERHPHIFYGCFYKLWPSRDGGSCTAGSRQNVVQGMLAEAQRNYSAAIATLLTNDQHVSSEVRDLEMQILLGVEMVRSQYARDYSRVGTPMPLVPAYLGADSIEPWRGRMAPIVALAGWADLEYPSMGQLDAGNPKAEMNHVRIMDPYHRGRQSLRRLYAYDAADRSSTPLSQAEAALLIADWDLLFSRHGEAVDRYELTHAMLENNGVPPALIEQLFSPATPVVLPAFQPNPLAHDEGQPVTGYVDIAFEITKYGRARSVDILAEMNATDEAKQRLVDSVAESRFRPRPMSGQFGVSSAVVMRYYINEPQREAGND